MSLITPVLHEYRSVVLKDVAPDILRRADMGDPRDLAKLVEDVLARDAFAGSLRRARAHYTILRPWRLVAAPSPLGQAIRDWAASAIDPAEITRLIGWIACAPPLGYAAAENAWDVIGDGDAVPCAFLPVDARYVVFAPDTDEPAIWTDAGPMLFPPGKLVFHVAPGIGLATRRGWIRAALDDVIEIDAIYREIVEDLGRGTPMVLPVGAAIQGCMTERAAERAQRIAGAQIRITLAACANMHLDADAIARTIRRDVLGPMVDTNACRLAARFGASAEDVRHSVPRIEFAADSAVGSDVCGGVIESDEVSE